MTQPRAPFSDAVKPWPNNIAQRETFTSTSPKASNSTTPTNNTDTQRSSTHTTNNTDTTSKAIAWVIFVVCVSSACLSILADIAPRVFRDTVSPVDTQQDDMSNTSSSTESNTSLSAALSTELSTELSTDPSSANTLDDTGGSAGGDTGGGGDTGAGDVNGAGSGSTGDVLNTGGGGVNDIAVGSSQNSDGPSIDGLPANQRSSNQRSFTIAATGDILIHGKVAQAAKTNTGWDFAPMFSHVKPLLEAADIAICHLETPLSIDNTDLAYYPSFRVPRELADAIAYAGYDTCSLASNHATDAGTDGIIGTINGLDKVKVAHSGMTLPGERSSINIVKAGPAAVAHLSYTYGFNQRNNSSHLSNLIDVDAILKEAREAKVQGADFVVLSMHWGTEYTTEPNTQQTELGAQLIASPNIDLILGHHAHVVQPIDKVGDKYIVYGMGNFISNQSPESCSRCPRGTQDGVIVHLVVSEDAATGDWAVSDIHHTPTWVDRDSSTYEILNASQNTDAQSADNASVDATDAPHLAKSAARTETALTSLGTSIRTR